MEEGIEIVLGLFQGLILAFFARMHVTLLGFIFSKSATWSSVIHPYGIVNSFENHKLFTPNAGIWRELVRK